MSWAVAVTKLNCERLVEDQLIRQGFEPYLPRSRERIVVAGQVRFRERILFGRYIFVRAIGVWHIVKRTFGIVNILQSGDKPALLQDSVIDELRSRHDVHGCVELPKFQVGQSVRVLEGPFKGSLGLYQGMTSKQRESVLLASLGWKAEFVIGNLEAA